MWIKRDISIFLDANQPGLPVQVIWGPRQSGKSSLLKNLNSSDWKWVTLDDFQARELANSDPALFLERYSFPVTIDEAQYSPVLFQQIKLQVDHNRIEKNNRSICFRLTGSHQILVDNRIKESLAGRAQYFRLHGLSVSEIYDHQLNTPIHEIIFKGGWPELYVNKNLNVIDYLNNYIQTVIEKDIMRASQIEKENQFMKAIRLLAARVGELIDMQDIAKTVGVSSHTILSWIQLLEKSGLAGLLRPYHNNLNKRLIKMPKFYFYDVGLATRLQGHQNIEMLMDSPQFGHLFENLVIAEVLKIRDHNKKNWELFFWRSKEKLEYDLIVLSGKIAVIIEAKVASQSAEPFKLNNQILKDLHKYTRYKAVITYGGQRGLISNDCEQVPISEFKSYLFEKLKY